ncbi:hydroxysqualene dehydroxylase HpnE [Hyphococcus lacteus]|uniref:Hydroxysqualene dehydroxylase HpnE n=1 Tax=Hyphococcus lacteus TaxID=3143536 RepID=A0ABV3Z935_9PROT
MSRVHIIGAGLSGLAAAVRLIENDVKVTVYDSAGHAGGRCRTFFDKHLEREIDNGNHLIMSGNKSSLSYLDRIGTVDPLTGPKFALYPFVDVVTKNRWTVRLNEGPIPFWVFDKKWRVPHTKLMDYVRAAKIAFANDAQTVADVVDPDSVLFERFWEPLTLAVLNTTPEKGQAKLLWRVIRETFLLGGQASIPLTAKTGLGHAFIDPAVKFIETNGGTVRVGARLRSAWMEGGEVTSLNFPDETVTLEPEDKVIFAIPPSRLKQLLPDIDPPEDEASILNIHYRLGRPVPKEALGDGPFIGMVSSAGQWAFVRDDVISITTSASDALGTDDMPNDQVVAQIWKEVCVALDLGEAAYERVRVIREKRATPDQSPAGVRKRLKPETHYRNLFLAGDHIDTGVPATIEGSIRSGDRAAELVLHANMQGKP